MVGGLSFLWHWGFGICHLQVESSPIFRILQVNYGMTATPSPHVVPPSGGPVDPLSAASGVWRPDLNAKQFDILYNRHPITLVSGPRMTGKSMGIAQAVCEHLWNTNGARVGIFVTSYKVATDGGSWTDVIDYAVPEWLGVQAGDQPGDDPDAVFEYTTFIRGSEEGAPKLDAKSRTPFFRIRNRFGGESECRLFSLDNENEIEAKTRGLRLSAVWCVELSTFKTRKVFEQTILLLRAHGVPDEKMFWIADTNPPEEGEDHWSWKLFYRDRVDPDYPDKQFQSTVGLIEIFLEDNPRLTPEKRRLLENSYRDSPDEYDRFVLGKWPKSGGRRLELFSDLLTPIHFPKGKIDVHRQTETLATGWDLGNTNSAAVIIDIPIISGIPYVSILDEVVHIDEEISTKDFTLEMLDKMIAINEHYKKLWYPTFPGFKWRHWSDSSSTDYYRASIGDVDAAIVYKETNGQIELIGVEKFDHTVEDDIKLIRMLLREKRLFIGDNCPALRKCLEKIRKGSSKAIDPKDPHKHVLDSFRYALRSEFLDYLHTPDKIIDPNARPAIQHFSIRGR